MSPIVENEKRRQVVECIASALETCGWVRPDRFSVALARKAFDTAVGTKDAFAWMQDFGPESMTYRLAGEYWSEGRNCLEACAVLVPKKAEPPELERLAKAWASTAADVVEETYAARLHRRWGDVAADALPLATEEAEVLEERERHGG